MTYGGTLELLESHGLFDAQKQEKNPCAKHLPHKQSDKWSLSVLYCGFLDGDVNSRKACSNSSSTGESHERKVRK